VSDRTHEVVSGKDVVVARWEDQFKLEDIPEEEEDGKVDEGDEDDRQKRKIDFHHAAPKVVTNTGETLRDSVGATAAVDVAVQVQEVECSDSDD
jgi:hypothetical protein